ncbi:YafY family transcriptional regulator [Photobacterium sp. WH77]|uniref:helix-turn-helix transcriptional regulator n=1 Tax=unclassified Photobacterium TaxID=2628852 RepID=UPI001ED9C89D|nr:YafY family transcriptional regulator [Photobacterium sp. WH77]MCG2846718.1 YafY family transcriptional regulator [Photobacterium sp. WH80]
MTLSESGSILLHMRTERLLQLLQILRQHRQPVSGQRLADELNISIRTLYRDIATLQAQGAQIDGEPGMGYVLKPGFFLPPLMLTEAEISAIMLGVRWVSAFGDVPMASAADSALAKVTAVLPADLVQGANEVPLRVGSPAELATEDLTLFRKAIRLERKLAIRYRAADGKESTRVIWPFAIGYFAQGRVLAAWCELRQDFRHFRTEWVADALMMDQAYPRRRHALFREWREKELRLRQG